MSGLAKYVVKAVQPAHAAHTAPVLELCSEVVASHEHDASGPAAKAAAAAKKTKGKYELAKFVFARRSALNKNSSSSSGGGGGLSLIHI